MNTTIQQREIIAQNVKRMLNIFLNDSQRVLKLSGVKTLTLDEFVSENKRLKKLISDYDQSEESIKEKEKDAFSFYDKAERKELQDQLNLHKYNVEKVSLTSEEINELLDLVSNSITKYGIDNKVPHSCNTGYFLCDILEQIDNPEEKVEKWLELNHANQRIIHSKIDGRYYINDEEILRIDANYNIVFVMKNNGEIIENDYTPAYLFADSVVRYEGKDLPLTSVLKQAGLECFTDSIYNKFDIRDLENALINIQLGKSVDSFSEVINVATNWWGNVIKNPIFDNGDESEVGANVKKLAKLSNSAQPNLTEDQLAVFTQVLSNKIKAQLIANGYCDLSVDYNPNIILAEAARVANLSDNMSTFPWKTSMTIKPNQIVVRTAKGKQELYQNHNSTLEKAN
ncbi:MAG: hypothetical protein PHR96_03930 [Clostridia bacterium]|nr:hypothetical protein [Clostridia bacterium]